MATDLAEFLGGALGLSLLFHIPMWISCLITCVLTFLICHMEKYGQKTVEIVITILIAVISISYIIEIFLADPNWGQVAFHTIVPELPNSEAFFIAVGILGATVMPHVIYLHSQLVQYRGADPSDAGKKHHLKMEKIDIAIAMNIAFFVNAAMLIISAAVFFKNSMAISTMEEAHRSLEPMLGSLSSGAFGIALLASGLSSSAVGTIAGQTIMKGFVGLSIPVQIRRIVTMLPAMVIIIIGVNPMNALICSQVVLSFILPIPIIQMLYVAGKKEIMGSFTNSGKVQKAGILIAALVIIFNIMLLLNTFNLM
jgi:manganese transport protein